MSRLAFAAATLFAVVLVALAPATTHPPTQSQGHRSGPVPRHFREHGAPDRFRQASCGTSSTIWPRFSRRPTCASLSTATAPPTTTPPRAGSRRTSISWTTSTWCSSGCSNTAPTAATNTSAASARRHPRPEMVEAKDSLKILFVCATNPLRKTRSSSCRRSPSWPRKTASSSIPSTAAAPTTLTAAVGASSPS